MNFIQEDTPKFLQMTVGEERRGAIILVGSN
jgi:hypothetical protein